LAASPEPGALKALALLSAARVLAGEPPSIGAARLVAGQVLWDGRSLSPASRPEERLAILRRVAYLEAGSRFLSGARVIDTLCLDLEYNQGVSSRAARAAAMESLESVGAGRLAFLAEETVAGAERALALLALALCRHPALLILERPLGFFGEAALLSAWGAVEAAMGAGMAALALDDPSRSYPERLFPLAPAMKEATGP
jgi:ABC-type cobalamin/Fe3+-siderophores transport system ATPase subunit